MIPRNTIYPGRFDWQKCKHESGVLEKKNEKMTHITLDTQIWIFRVYHDGLEIRGGTWKHIEGRTHVQAQKAAHFMRNTTARRGDVRLQRTYSEYINNHEEKKNETRMLTQERAIIIQQYDYYAHCIPTSII